MPFYDRVCPDGHQLVDSYEPVTTPEVACPTCGQPTVRAWFTTPPSVIGDECDIAVRHGLCQPDGAPTRFTSKAELARAAKARGLMNRVEHRGTRTGDRSPHTTRWI